jgi:hypothetical protein
MFKGPTFSEMALMLLVVQFGAIFTHLNLNIFSAEDGETAEAENPLLDDEENSEDEEYTEKVLYYTIMLKKLACQLFISAEGS